MYVIQEFGQGSRIQFYHGHISFDEHRREHPWKPRTMKAYVAVALCCPLVVSCFTAVLFRTVFKASLAFPAVIRSGEVFTFLKCRSDSFFYAQLVFMASQ